MAETNPWSVLEALAASVVEDAQHWPQFVAALHPRATELARVQPIGRLRNQPDDLREIALRVVAKLHRDHHRVLASYFAKPDRPSFRAWIRRVVASSALDYLRQYPEFRRTADSGDRWVDLVSVASQCGGANPNASIDEKRQQVLLDLQGLLDAVCPATDEQLPALAARWNVSVPSLRRLRKRSSHAVPVFRAALAGLSQRETADSLGLSRRDVELTLAYVEELLRERYRTTEAS